MRNLKLILTFLFFKYGESRSRVALFVCPGQESLRITAFANQTSYYHKKHDLFFFEHTVIKLHNCIFKKFVNNNFVTLLYMILNFKENCEGIAG
jgi:hypothetical protein